MLRIKKAILSALVGVGLFLISGQAVMAIEYGMLGGKPANPDPNVENSGSWFLYNLNPGESTEDSLLVMNLFEDSFNVLVYAADTTKSSGGGFALKQYSEPKDQVGAWVRFYPDSVPRMFQGVFEKKESKIIPFCKLTKEELQEEYGKIDLTEENFSEFEKWCQGTDHVEKNMKANEKTTLPFVFSVPNGADVGEHTGGILIQKVGAEDTTDAGGSAVKLTTRVGVRIYETVPGEIVKKINLDNFDVIKNFKEFDFAKWFGGDEKAEEYLVQSKIKSESNVSIENENIIYIGDLLFGKRSEDISRTFQVLKNDIFISNYSWSNPRFGRFSFQTEIRYKDASGQEQKILSDEIKIWVMPWREIAFTIFGLMALVLAYFGWKKYQKKKYGGIGWVEYKVKKSDTMAKLADRYEINWHILAKTNKIGAPYVLTVGSTILVPGDGKEAGKGKKTLAAKKENDIEAKDKIAEEAASEEKTEEEVMVKKTRKKTSSRKAVESSAKKGSTNKVDVMMEKLSKKIDNKPATVEKEIISSKKIIWIVVTIAVLLLVVLGGVFMVLNMNEKKNLEIQEKNSIISALEKASQEKKPEIKQEEKPQAEEKKSVAIADIGMSILNESGVAGAAGKVQELLVEKGYSKAEAGNGENEGTIGSMVFYKSAELEKEAAKVVEILKEKKIEAKIEKGKSGQQIGADLVIVLGK